MQPHPRLAWLEGLVERIRDGHHATLLLASVPATGRHQYLAPPVVDWQPGSKLRKFDGWLSPVEAVCTFRPGLYSEGFSVRRKVTAGAVTRTQRFEVTEPLPAALLRGRLREMKLSGERAQQEVVNWSEPFRFKHTMSASASLSMKCGVNEGFLFDMADVSGVTADLVPVVLDQFHRYAGITRHSKTNGKPLTGRPQSGCDIEKTVSSYLRSRAYRMLESMLNNGCAADAAGTARQAVPVASTVAFLEQVNGSVVVADESDRPEVSVECQRRALDAHTLVSAAVVGGLWGARAAAVQCRERVACPGLVEALRTPWPGLSSTEWETTLNVLIATGDSDAHDEWCDALHWWAAEQVPAPQLQSPVDASLAAVRNVRFGRAWGARAVAELLLADRFVADGVLWAFGEAFKGRSMRQMRDEASRLVLLSSKDADRCWAAAVRANVADTAAMMAVAV